MVQGNRQKYLRETYIARINRVIDYIESNICSDLSLEELADVAHFSPFHFHRIFRAMVGEPLNGFIQRVRIEKAASKLIANPRKPITEIAFESGFSSSSAFARAFKLVFQMNASQWRSKQQGKNSILDSKKCKAERNPGQDFEVNLHYNVENNKQIWRIIMTDRKLQTNIEVKDMPERHVVYVRHIGAYQGNTELFGSLFQKLMTWAGPRGLLNFPETKMLSVYHDSPDITDESKLRTDVCITVPENTEVDGEIGKETIPGGKYAVGHFEISVDQYEDAWNTIFGGWLPQSGYQCVDGPCYELYLNDPSQHPEGKCIVDIYVPVKPL